jgi:hypothetical protein
MSEKDEGSASVAPEAAPVDTDNAEVTEVGPSETFDSASSAISAKPIEPVGQKIPTQGSDSPSSVTPVPVTLTENEDNFEKWIENFYKECGRETTLAYTTLNQMKNWAMVIAAAFISAIVTLGRPAEGEVKPTVLLGMYAAAVVAYVFNLRFFIRAVLCYINLIRWNRLQASIIATFLVPKPTKIGEVLLTAQQARVQLQADIQDYYHDWRSPINRKTQIVQNLKLGFALVLALPLFFVIVWSVELWANWLVRGLAVFAVGSTLVELTDFFRSSFFDTPERNKRRPTSRKIQVFPVPVSQGGYLLTWALNLIISSTVALWPALKPLLDAIWHCRS